MRSSLLALVFHLVSINSFASTETFDIDVKYSLDGSTETEMALILEENKKGSLTNKTKNEDFELQVVATKSEFSEFQGVILDMQLKSSGVDGAQKISSESLVLAENGQDTSVVFTTDDGTEKTFKIRATKR